MTETFLAHLSAELGGLKSAGLYKSERVITSMQSAEIAVGGENVLNFCANNYLGLADNEDIREAALLLALAGLADRASGLPACRRFNVLCYLAHGEAEARAFVTGTAFDPSGQAGDAAFPSADCAARLAASFRALALVLGAMLAQAGRFARSLRREAAPRAGLAIGPRKPAEPKDRTLHYAARGPPGGLFVVSRTAPCLVRGRGH